MARILGVGEYGKYIYALSWVGILVLFAKHGMDTALVRYVAGYRARGEWALMRGILLTGFRSVLATSIVLAVLAASVVFYLKAHIEAGQAETIWISLILLPIVALTGIRQSALQAMRHVALAQLPETIIRPIVLVLIIVAGNAFMTDALTAQQAMLSNILAAMIAFYIGGRLLVRRLPSEVRDVSSEHRGSEWFKASIPLFLISGMHMALGQTDIVMIGPMLGSDAAGIYAAAARVSGLVGFGLAAVNSIVAPMISELYVTNRHEDLQRMIMLSARGVSVFAVGAGAVLILFAEPLLGLFGDEFVAGVRPLYILLIGQAVNALAGSVGFLMIMTGQQSEAAKIVGISAVCNIALNATLIPLFGLSGAAIATAATTVMWNVAMLRHVYRKLGINPTVFAGIGR
jgi:O-antigen/teichoic acid export membrane protein